MRSLPQPRRSSKGAARLTSASKPQHRGTLDMPGWADAGVSRSPMRCHASPAPLYLPAPICPGAVRPDAEQHRARHGHHGAKGDPPVAVGGEPPTSAGFIGEVIAEPFPAARRCRAVQEDAPHAHAKDPQGEHHRAGPGQPATVVGCRRRASEGPPVPAAEGLRRGHGPDRCRRRGLARGLAPRGVTRIGRPGGLPRDLRFTRRGRRRRA